MGFDGGGGVKWEMASKIWIQEVRRGGQVSVDSFCFNSLWK